MTNITAEQRLALARAVYPDAKCNILSADVVSVYDVLHEGQMPWAMPFLPESNPAQLIDVLCWLFNQRGRKGNFHELTPWQVKQIYFTEDDNEPVTSKTFMHDNTPASLSDAIVRAAVRVREGE